MQKIAPKIQRLDSLSDEMITTDILRIDAIHPVVSGNKWFKLSKYLEDALQQRATAIATFGGAYSNHIVAAAYAAKECGLASVGFIRGERTASQPTLAEAESYGMELRFVSREAYRDKAAIRNLEHQAGWYWIPEGGYGAPGVQGAAGILASADTGSYTHILCAVGTGTMMAGLVTAALPHQQVTGICVLKNARALAELEALLGREQQQGNYTILHDYHWGGYAKHPDELIAFIRDIWAAEALPTDFVYTGKLVFAAQDLVRKKYFPAGSRLLLIHSGGLQGNRSLPAGTLPF